MTVKVDVEGDERLAATLDNAADDLTDMHDALEQAGRIVQARARAGAPVRTGALARSITATATATEVQVGPHVGVYAGVQEYGSATTPAHPYLRPALDASNTLILGVFTEETNQALHRVKGA